MKIVYGNFLQEEWLSPADLTVITTNACNGTRLLIP